MGSRGATSRCSFVYLCFILHSSVLFHASIWLRTPHTPVGNPIWTHIYVTIRLFIIAPPSISMPLTNPSVSNFNFMQLSQVPNKTISDKSFSHLSRSDGPLPAAHHGEVCEDLSNYRVINLTRPLFLLPAKAHSFETICLLFRIEHNLDFVLYCTVITDYQNKYWGSGTFFRTLIRQYSTF